MYLGGNEVIDRTEWSRKQFEPGGSPGTGTGGSIVREYRVQP